MEVEIRSDPDCGEVAAPQDGDAVHAIGPQVEDAKARLVAVGYLVGIHDRELYHIHHAQGSAEE